MRDLRKIKAWQQADDLAYAVYQATQSFPKEELYGLTSQVRRAAVSVAANIAEGSGRQHQREYLQFLSVAASSLREVQYYIHLARRLGYLGESCYSELDATRDETARILHGLIESVKRQV